ncbi:helix-turn-helix domain-containing protein [Marinomonas ostreistagni]|uniref:Helix-turn-helix transcriptional regulator n=1 Tax=Marinomonas ostreistagni TaxID=359209 RepID=A0ABS0ZBJ6_9GAMM|nr:AraC family transcriptional regulator [Marinomonas ostreistagni]MBJ7551049.1 helix-turn-helix transcriptional regulator [Marinomonas ostreistagni]
MVAIPLPFVVSLLLCVLAGSLWMQRRHTSLLACAFLLMCAFTTFIVGLRWALDAALLRTLQPICASLIPVLAWWVFAKARSQQRLPWWHGLLPALVCVCAVTYPWWQPPVDMLITAEYIAYGVALWRSAKHSHALENVRLSDLNWAIQSERVAGTMLLFSALIDGAMTLDFMLYQGHHAVWILSIGHAMLLPTLALSVVCLSVTTTEDIEHPAEVANGTKTEDNFACTKDEASLDEEAGAVQISQQANKVLKEQALYLDPDLTLAKIARKAGIPARQISAAINRTASQNVSQWVNQYRIEHAKNLLTTTDAPITQIYLDSGFQTKSNFHREFSRLTKQTPSSYRKTNCTS